MIGRSMFELLPCEDSQALFRAELVGVVARDGRVWVAKNRYGTANTYVPRDFFDRLRLKCDPERVILRHLPASA